MLTDLELMSIQVSALFTQNPEARLLFINEPDNAAVPAPRLFLGRTRLGNIWRFRADIPENLVQELTLLCMAEPTAAELKDPPGNIEAYVRLLKRHGPVERVSSGPAYCFSERVVPSRDAVVITEKDAELLRDGFEDLIEELSTWQPFVAIVEGYRAVSVCRSVRITPEAHEAGVKTLPDFRGRGYAKDVAAEWARRVSAIGAIPLYSTSWENNASQAVARKLGLKCYGADFQIS
jgi:ribosomal protein S18 acetylase RimI-like enzyme